jgi:hypothetical protein
MLSLTLSLMKLWQKAKEAASVGDAVVAGVGDVEEPSVVGLLVRSVVGLAPHSRMPPRPSQSSARQ